MGMVATCHRLASTCIVFFGRRGGITRYAHQRGVSRQTV
jgi:hypothetical protein